MELLTAKERKELKARAHHTRCVSIQSRVNQLVSEGIGVSEAKMQTANEMGITVVTVYKDLRWLKEYEKTNNNQ